MARRARQGSTGTPATVALTRAGVPFTLHPYEHDPRAESYGLEAAAALDVEPARVFKTLLARLGTETVVGIVPVSGQLDLKSLARTLGGGKATMAPAADAERATGYVTGGISPIAQRRRHRTVLDATAFTYDTVYVSGGRRGLDIELAPSSLVTLTAGLVAPIAR